MTIFTKILAGGNLFMALVVFFMAGNVVSSRNNWTKHLDERKRLLEGIQTDELLAKLDPEMRRLVVEDPDTRSESGAGKRLQAVDRLTKSQPLSPEAQKFAQEIGPEDYKKLVQKVSASQRPKLLAEEQRIAAKKILLQNLKDGYEDQIARLDVKIKWLRARLENERGLETKVLAENTDRRRELAGLYVELEEALAARNLAQKQLADMQTYHDMTVKQRDELTKKNSELAGQLRTREAVDAEAKRK